MPVTTDPPTGKIEVRKVRLSVVDREDPVWSGFEAIVARVEAGESVRSCCDKPGGPTRNQFRRAIAGDPALRQRYDAAIAKWSAPHARSLIHFDEIERRIVAGGAILDILAAGRTFPDYTSWRKFLATHPEHDARYRAAFRRREAGPAARGIVPKYSDHELRAAAEKLAAAGTRYISVKRVASNGPHASTLMAARRRSADLCAVIERAAITRIQRLKILAGPMFKPLTPGLVLPRRRRPRVIYKTGLLIASLRRNEIYALAEAAVPRHLNPVDRADIVAQTVLEVIEDELDLDMVADVAREVISDHFGCFRSKMVSLDARIYSDSTVTLGDKLTTGWD